MVKGRGRSIILGLAAVYPVCIIALTAFQYLFPQRSGPLALLQVFAPYLFLPLVLLAPFALMRGAKVLCILLGACLLLFIVRYGPNINLLPSTSDPVTSKLEVINWNVGIATPLGQIARVRPVVAEGSADVVVLEEAQWGWLADDEKITALYPYQLQHTVQASSGLVLLSKYPFLEHEVPKLDPGLHGWPRVIMARLELGDGKAVTVIAAHPEAPYSGSGCRPPWCYDPSERDSLVPLLRGYVDRALAAGEPLLLAGDFNTTPREPAYGELSAGLIDAQARVGAGFGNSWPLLPVAGGVALLPIDHLFSSAALTPRDFNTDCTPRGSDHCLIRGTFGLAP